MQEVIKAEHLTKSYGKLLAADDICLTVSSGMVFGLLGANGAGKSTTIECILGMKKADNGKFCLPIVVLVILGVLYGNTPAYEGAAGGIGLPQQGHIEAL